MKKTISVITTTTFCDACDASAHGYTCRYCGIDHCYICAEKLGIKYAHAIYFSGPDDGYYCHQCDYSLRLSGHNKMHSAYRTIADLQRQNKSYAEHFDLVKKEAEAALITALEESKLEKDSKIP
jgi:hypothetical protein